MDSFIELRNKYQAATDTTNRLLKEMTPLVARKQASAPGTPEHDEAVREILPRAAQLTALALDRLRMRDEAVQMVLGDIR